jgi:hypothetical protein
VKSALIELAERLQHVAQRIENVGLNRAAEDIRKVAAELVELAQRTPAAAAPPPGEQLH